MFEWCSSGLLKRELFGSPRKNHNHLSLFSANRNPTSSSHLPQSFDDVYYCPQLVYSAFLTIVTVLTIMLAPPANVNIVTQGLFFCPRVFFRAFLAILNAIKDDLRIGKINNLLGKPFPSTEFCRPFVSVE